MSILHHNRTHKHTQNVSINFHVYLHAKNNKIIVSIRRNLQYLSAGKKSTKSFTFSLRYCKLVILGTLGMSGYAHPKWYYQLLCLSMSPMFLWRYYKYMQTFLFWVSWVCLALISISILLRAIVLRPCRPAEFIDNSTCRVESPTSLF